MDDISLTFTLSDRKSILEANYFPTIELPANKKYVLGLIDLLTYNSIPNIDTTNNKFHILNQAPIEIPVGSYEISDIENFLKKKLEKTNTTLSLKANNDTLKCEIESDHHIAFDGEDSVGNLLGFSKEILTANSSTSF